MNRLEQAGIETVLFSIAVLLLSGAYFFIHMSGVEGQISLTSQSLNALISNLNVQVAKNGAQLEWNLQDSHRLIESLTGTNAQLRHTLLDVRQMADEAKKASDANIDQISKTTAASTAFLVHLDQNVNGRMMPKLEASLEQFRGGMEQFNTFMRLMPPVATEAHGTLVEVHGIAADGHKVADIYTKKAIEATKPLSLGKRIAKFALSGFFKLIMFQL